MQTNNLTYDANFTAGGLLHHEFISLEVVITGDNMLEQLKKEEVQNNYMAVNTLSARKRILSEVKKRLSYAPSGFWDHFYSWSEKEQKLALFYLCLKAYKVVFDIHWEVSLKKFLTGGEIDAYNISMFLDELASKNNIVASWSNSTIEKINVQYRKAIRDAGLVMENKPVKPNGLNESFWTYFKNIDETWFLEACFIA